MLNITKSADELLNQYGMKTKSLAHTFADEVEKHFHGLPEIQVMGMLQACDYFNSPNYEFKEYGELVLVDIQIPDDGEKVSIDFRYGVGNCSHVCKDVTLFGASLSFASHFYEENIQYYMQLNEEGTQVGYEITYTLSVEHLHKNVKRAE